MDASEKKNGESMAGWEGRRRVLRQTSNRQTKYLDIAKGSTGKSKKPTNFCKLLAEDRQQTSAMRHAEKQEFGKTEIPDAKQKPRPQNLATYISRTRVLRATVSEEAATVRNYQPPATPGKPPATNYLASSVSY